MPQVLKPHPHNKEVPWSWIDRDEVIEEFDDDWWIDDQTFDHATIIVFWLLRRLEEDDVDDDWVNSSLITDDYPVDVIGTDDPADENDVDPGDWFYTRQSDLVFDTDQVVYVLDNQIDDVEPDQDDDYLVYYREEYDLVTDFDHVVVILDDQIDDYPLDTDDDWILDKLVDAAAAVVVPDFLVPLDEDLGIELLDDDDDWQNLPFDQVYDTDQVYVIVDEDDRVDEDDDWTYRLSDEIYDIDQIVTVLDDQIDYVEPDQDDDYIIYRLDDLAEDIDHIIDILDDQIDDVPQDDEDAWYDAYGQIDQPVVVTGAELILVLYPEEDIDPDSEDDFSDAYGNIDLPIVVQGFAGRQITEEEVEAEEFEFLKPVDYPEKLHFPDSSHIETVLYDKKSGEMQIKFKEGSTYKYEGVKPNKFKGIGRARSTGTYFHNKIKPIHPGKKM